MEASLLAAICFFHLAGYLLFIFCLVKFIYSKHKMHNDGSNSDG